MKRAIYSEDEGYYCAIQKWSGEAVKRRIYGNFNKNFLCNNLRKIAACNTIDHYLSM